MSKKAVLILSMAAPFAALLFFVLISIGEISYALMDSRSAVLYDSRGGILACTLSADDRLRIKTVKDEVSPVYLQFLLANEDRNFYSHAGVDFKALIRAFITNLKTGKVSSGGSTIAMQVAKTLTGHKQRTYANKLKEIICALYLTAALGRDEVLNLYLTLAPFGSNIEGVKAASLKWFNHMPDRLTLSEAALLAALPRAPEHIRPDRNPKGALYYKNEVLKLALKNGLISETELKLSLKDSVNGRLHDIDSFSLPVLNELLAENPGQKEFYTSLDEYQMRLLRTVASDFESSCAGDAVLSAIILDCSTKKITAILGSSSLRKTQLALPYRLRSPGSALKPFVYAMAMNEGKLHPDTILHDDRKLLGTWAPNNFDRDFKGEVSAKDALSLSLNLPAIEVLKLVGEDSFISSVNALKKGEKPMIRTAGSSDLSVVLGSADIRLTDLAKLYAMLNCDGMYYEYTLLDDAAEDAQPYHRRFVSKDAARATFNILKSTPRPDSALSETAVSYKTGTSYRFNDALAIGSLGNYTAGVAIRYVRNNASKEKGQLYTGYKSAAPILFEIFKKLDISPFKKEKLSSALLREVPKALRENHETKESLADRDRLYIDFPRNGDTVTPNSDRMVFVRYHGGKGRVYLNADDRQTDRNYFIADKEGFYTVELIDEQGHSDTVTFKVVFR